MAHGMQGHLAIGKQALFGTAETSSLDYVPIISETLTTNIEQLVREGLYARPEAHGFSQGILTVAGDITFEPHPVMLGHFLRGVSGQASCTTGNSGAVFWQFVPKNTDYSSLCPLPPYTINVYRGVDSAWQFTDAQIHTLTVEITGGAIVRATAGVIARISSLMDPGTAAMPTGDPWTWNGASVALNAAGCTDFENISVTMENPIEGVTTLDGNYYQGRFYRSGFRTAKVSGTLDFASQDQYNQFRVFSKQALGVFVLGTSLVESHNIFEFQIPELIYTSHVVGIPGPGRISASIEGEGQYHVGSSYSIRPTMTNTRTSY